MSLIAAPEALALLPPDAAGGLGLLPLAVEGDTLTVVLLPSAVPGALREAAFFTGKRVVAQEADPEEAQALLHALCGTTVPSGSGDGMAGSEPLEPSSSSRSGVLVAGIPDRPPVLTGSAVQQVNELLHTAIERGASDLHLEPYEHAFRVRCRLDGVLHPVAEVAPSQRDAVVSRIKVMAGLDIAEKRRPQDGRIRVRRGDRDVDLRVSTLPTQFGEKVVLRVLDKGGIPLDLPSLGLAGGDLDAFRRAIRAPHGVVLVTGPTGSGKTTTLYAALGEVNAPGVNVLTAEDPVEYTLTGVNQTAVRPEIGLTFAAALRAFLRQDPDVVMVGEVRDAETAGIAVRAALTGHLVLSTLHTNDAPSTPARLLDMGVEPYLLASALRLVLAQRLVRRVCPHCAREAEPDAALLRELGAGAPSTYAEGAGCDRCNGTGYRGRAALFEVMPVSEPLAELIAQRAGTRALRDQARTEGVRPLREAALALVRQGVTTPQEALRATAL